MIVAIVLVLLVALVMVTGLGGEHGPGRHLPASGGSEDVGGVGGPAAADEAARTAAVTTLGNVTFESSRGRYEDGMAATS